MLLVAAPPQVTLTAPTHTPKINVRWYYTVRATRDGKPVAARLTAQIVDPIGGVHPVQFGTTHEEHHELAVQGHLPRLHHLAGRARAGSR